MRRTDIRLLFLIALMAGLTAVVFSCGNPQKSDDTTPPMVSITNPIDNTAVPNSVDVRAEATDNEAVAKVEFYIDTQLHSFDEISPYACYWIIGADENGEHTIFAKAFDEAGNWECSDLVTVTCEATPPAVVADLAATDPDIIGDITLSWTAPGEDGATGTAAAYDIRSYWTTITADNWVSATRYEGEPTPQVAGTAESFDIFGLSLSSHYFFAIRTQDASGNWSEISNVVEVTTMDLLGSPYEFSVGDDAASFEVADFDGDLDLDIAIGHRKDDDNVSIFMNNGNGTFGSATVYYARPDVSSLAASDIDNDGDLDLSATSFDRIYPYNGDFVSRISVLLNDGTGLFELQNLDTYDTTWRWCNTYHYDPVLLIYVCDVYDATPQDTNSVLNWFFLTDSMVVDTNTVAFYADSNACDSWLADFNNDGWDDLVVTNFGMAKVSVLTGNGDGTYNQPVNYGTNKSEPFAVCAADFDNDGWVDIANTNAATRQVSVFWNQGDGSFSSESVETRLFVDVGTGAYSIYPSDVDGDGFVDLVAAVSEESNVWVLINDGDRDFQATTRPAGSGARAIFAEDFNGDGAPELAVANFNDDNISLMMNGGDFLFYSYNTTEFAAGDGPTAIHCADFDGDGDNDVAVLNHIANSNTVTILYNVTVD